LGGFGVCTALAEVVINKYARWWPWTSVRWSSEPPKIFNQRRSRSSHCGRTPRAQG